MLNKVVIGTDGSEESSRAIALAGRLRLKDSSYELVHVIERLAPVTFSESPAVAADMIDMVLRQQEQAGKQAIERGSAEMKAQDLAVANTAVKTGFAANVLIDTCRESKASLLAVGSRGRGRLEAALFGSVARKLAVAAPCSLLIARNAPRRGGMHALIATDHSEYANRCIDRLIAMAPQGIERVTVLTAIQGTVSEAIRAVVGSVQADAAEWVKRGLAAENAAVAARLASVCGKVETRVVDDEPSAAIDKAMHETNADLLVLGSQGHGFVDRVMLGSVSFRQVVDGRHDLLILRC